MAATFVALTAVVVYVALHDDPPLLDQAVADAGPAHAPFRGLTEAEFRIGDHDVRLVIADGEDERVQGLRRRETIGRYDGMLFAFDETGEHTFTMSTVPVALDIAFYDIDGNLVNRFRMKPCAGTETDCPAYPSVHPFRFAVETLVGDLPPGPLRAE